MFQKQSHSTGSPMAQGLALLEPKPEAEEEIQTCVHSLTTPLWPTGAASHPQQLHAFPDLD